MKKNYLIIALFVILTACNLMNESGSPSSESNESGSLNDGSASADETPGELVLSKSSESVEIGSSVYISVQSDMGNDASFSINPALPQGLEFNLSTGDITGYALEPKAAESYTVTAAGNGWSHNACLSLAVTSSQPEGFRNIDGLWVEPDGDAYICGTDSDCGDSLTCNGSIPGGLCTGCALSSDCPETLECMFGYCLMRCVNNSDCGEGKFCSSSGYCSVRVCAGNSDCGDNYYCHHNNGDEPNNGRCYRKPVE